MIFAAIMVYFAKERLVRGDGLFCVGVAAACELVFELAIIAAHAAK